MASAYSQLLVGLAFSVVLIYLLIVVNFQSWLDPFVIVTPRCRRRSPVSYGCCSSATPACPCRRSPARSCAWGVATANSILVISFARERLAAGRTALEAALEAGATRLRPVMMTALG